MGETAPVRHPPIGRTPLLYFREELSVWHPRFPAGEVNECLVGLRKSVPPAQAEVKHFRRAERERHEAEVHAGLLAELIENTALKEARIENDHRQPIQILGRHALLRRERMGTRN